jgi:signal transduction histidine kinase
MEIKKAPRQANQFWPNFHNKKISLIVFCQFIIVLIISLLFIFSELADKNSVKFWIIISLLLVINTSVSILIFKISVKPMRDLMSVILSISGERSDLKPPNPNEDYYANSGLGDAINTLFKLSSAQPVNSPQNSNYFANGDKTSNDPKTEAQPYGIEKALDESLCGFVAMSHDKKIVYSNKAAPVSINHSGQKILNLIFNGSDTLDNWLINCENEAVHADKIWTRIPDKLPNEENRRFFDVIASYHKGASTEVVLNLIDRTSFYKVDEENLDFIAFAAHELRGPITVIRGYLDVLEDELSPVLQGDQHELFHRLVVSANRLSSYINNILNTSSYDRRHLKMHLSEGKVTEVYDIINVDMSLRASSQKRILNINIPKDLPTIAVDRNSMSEVFSNLIDNAIKYSDEGGVISVNAKANGNFVEVSVQDNGIGMPDSVIGNLFHKFYRSHRSRETVAGTGIGLYISKAIVESHGGNISVRSQEDKGSVFTVSIPIYSTVADKLKALDNSNVGLISEGKGWINNHSMFRG